MEHQIEKQKIINEIVAQIGAIDCDCPDCTGCPGCQVNSIAQRIYNDVESLTAEKIKNEIYKVELMNYGILKVFDGLGVKQ